LILVLLVILVMDLDSITFVRNLTVIYSDKETELPIAQDRKRWGSFGKLKTIIIAQAAKEKNKQKTLANKGNNSTITSQSSGEKCQLMRITWA
jgi:ribosomal protein L7Ae-like RNA K-turn-binding protein